MDYLKKGVVNIIKWLKKLGIGKKKEENSKNVAKDRLQFILVQDRTRLTPAQMDSLKKDLLKVLKKYIDVDERKIQMEVNREEETVAMVANFPIKNSG